jgi:hypothetical protein
MMSLSCGIVLISFLKLLFYFAKSQKSFLFITFLPPSFSYLCRMLISNQNFKKTVRWALLAFAALSIADFIVARINHPVSAYFWGYLIAVFTLTLAMLYLLLGKPYFKMSVENDLLNFRTGIISNPWLDEKLKINRHNLVDFQIQRRFFRTILVLSVLGPNGVMKKAIGISYLSKHKIEALEAKLAELTAREENEHLFI